MLMKSSHKYWSAVEEQALRRLWPAPWRALVDALPARSRTAITMHAREIGLPKQFTRGEPWSGAENRLLRLLRAQGMGAKEIHKRMPQRSSRAIEMQAHRMEMVSLRNMRRITTTTPVPGARG
jgi:hypothetical protein